MSLMELQTKFQGLVEVCEKEKIIFENGIPGFPEEEEFFILPVGDDEVFLTLQSAKSQELAFIIINPFHYFPQYDFELDQQVIEKLEIEAPEDILVLNIITIHDPFEQSTANLRAPLIINKKRNHGKQVVLNNEHFTTRHKIMG